MSCICAVHDTYLDRYVCNINDEECMCSIPNSKVCAEQYGEGPDLVKE
ncbi:hypothetical protein [Clostridium saccharoperbutylacetonicum]